MVYGPQVDAWLRAWAGRPRVGRIVERVSRVPTSVAMSAAGVWHFVSESTRRTALGGVGPLANRGHAGRDRQRAVHRTSRAALEWRLLYVGRLDPRKGVDTAIKALPSLPPEATLELVGDGDPRYAAELRSLAARARRRRPGAARRGPPTRRDAGDLLRRRRDRLPGSLGGAVGAGPARGDGGGHGRCSPPARGGSAEYLRDEENCLLFPPDDAQALAAGLRALGADPALRRS